MVTMTIAKRGDYSESSELADEKRHVKIPVFFLGSHKTANCVSLNGHRGPKNENHQKIYTYLNAAKAENSGYTNF